MGQRGPRSDRERGERLVTVPSSERPPDLIRATWIGDHRFDTGRAVGVQTRIDGSGETGQTPPDALLSALASCSGVDVVDILAKRRTPVTTLSIEVEGERRTEAPRRFQRLLLTFHIEGDGIERVHAERAVRLAFEKYCSVAASLAPDIVTDTIVVLNGSPGERARQKTYVTDGA